MSCYFSPELTFIPKNAPYGLVDPPFDDLVSKINEKLKEIAKFPDSLMVAKTEGNGRNVKYASTLFCIEITPNKRFDYHDFYEGSQLETMLIELFRLMEADFGLVPLVIKQRNGIEKHANSGGCHLQLDSSIFGARSNWYDATKLFHQHLVVDNENRPYVRWLFSEWFNNISCSSIMATRMNRKWTVKSLFEAHFTHSSENGVRARFMNTGKRSYNTFELRFFNMVKDVKELSAIVRFAQVWFDQMKKKTFEGEKPAITLTPESLADMKDLRKSRALCKSYIQSLGLKWKDYEVFYNRNYRNRILYGEFK